MPPVGVKIKLVSKAGAAGMPKQFSLCLQKTFNTPCCYFRCSLFRGLGFSFARAQLIYFSKKDRLLIMKKYLFLTLFFIIFSNIAIFANDDTEFLLISSLYDNSIMNTNPDFFSNNETGRSFSTGQRAGFGFLNIFFGLGSFIMGDWWSGVKILACQILGYGCLYGGIDLLYPIWISKAGNPGDVFSYFFGGLVLTTGICFTVFSLVLDFLYPAIYGTPRERGFKPFYWKNFNFNLLLNEQGKINGQILFAIKY